MRRSLVLDFDGSVAGRVDAAVLSLQTLHDRIRFGCSLRELRALADPLDAALGTFPGVVFLGSGDFHHVSLPLIQRAARRGPLEVVVLDNHPDNMRWLGGIHCGSWVRHVARLAAVRHVHVLGITSADISRARLWENYLSPLWRGKLTYWSVGQPPSLLHRLANLAAFRNFDSPAELCEAFAAEQARNQAGVPVYLSIDKDVLSPSLVTCNWDQGCFDESHVHAVLSALQGRVIGCDITGEISTHEYRTRWKRWVASLDAQPDVDLPALEAHQREHDRLNARLQPRILAAMVPEAASDPACGLPSMRRVPA
ncbi:MAG: hypothetical protein U1F39_12360 [Steroidobacteraceae bacterium]